MYKHTIMSNQKTPRQNHTKNPVTAKKQQKQNRSTFPADDKSHFPTTSSVYASILPFTHKKSALSSSKSKQPLSLRFNNIQPKIATTKKNARYPVNIIQHTNNPVLQKEKDRFLTIYSFGMTDHNKKPRATPQGPHTLAHTSIDYLTQGKTLQDLQKQILSPEKILEILATLGVTCLTDTKAQNYMNTYQELYQALQASLGKKPVPRNTRTEIRRLMELHPLTVYAWLGNIKQKPHYHGKAASKSSLKGKGERNGSTLFFDRKGKTIRKTTGNTTGITIAMSDYLKLRLSLIIKDEERLQNAVETLLKTGRYQIQTADRKPNYPQKAT